MLTHTTRWSHPPGNPVVPSRWQATFPSSRLACTSGGPSESVTLPLWTVKDGYFMPYGRLVRSCLSIGFWAHQAPTQSSPRPKTGPYLLSRTSAGSLFFVGRVTWQASGLDLGVAVGEDAAVGEGSVAFWGVVHPAMSRTLEHRPTGSARSHFGISITVRSASLWHPLLGIPPLSSFSAPRRRGRRAVGSADQQHAGGVQPHGPTPAARRRQSVAVRR